MTRPDPTSQRSEKVDIHSGLDSGRTTHQGMFFKVSTDLGRYAV